MNIDKLIEGYKVFYKKYFVSAPEIYSDLAKHGQSPKSLVIACSDSRVDPAIVVNAEPGYIFVVRNVANLVPCNHSEDHNNAVGAALEYAVQYLGVGNIIIMGHSACGGIQASIERDKIDDYPLVSRWVSILDDIAEEQKKLGDENLTQRCEHAAIKQSFHNLRTYPFVTQKEQEGKLNLYGWYFDFHTGGLSAYSEDTGAFEAV